MSDSQPLYLMNCRSCEDIQRLTEKKRTCECGKTSGSITHDEPKVAGTYARVLAMQFEDYDNLAPGEVACLVVL